MLKVMLGGIKRTIMVMLIMEVVLLIFKITLFVIHARTTRTRVMGVATAIATTNVLVTLCMLSAGRFSKC